MPRRIAELGYRRPLRAFAGGDRGQDFQAFDQFPPRCGKTIITSVCWIAWTWARRETTFRSGPPVRFLTGSYSHTLALGDADLDAPIDTVAILSAALGIALHFPR